jgi:dienelactone hydrolase
VRELTITAATGEPLSAWLGPERARGAATERRFELTSRGDRVGGRLWQPLGAARAPWLLGIHDLGSAAGDPALAEIALHFARSGRAFAAIDLPLHGERTNAKLSRRAIAAGSGAAPETAIANLALWEGLVRQAVHDLARALDALAAAAPALAPARVASLGIGLGADIAAKHAALDLRVERAIWLGARRTRPDGWATLHSPRPLLQVAAAPRGELAGLRAAANEVERFLADEKAV